MLQALFCFFDAGDMTNWNPPEGQEMTVEALKPLAPLSLHILVLTLVDKGKEVVKAGPDGKIDKNTIIVIWSQSCGVAFFCLEAPDEARTVISQGVNVI